MVELKVEVALSLCRLNWLRLNCLERRIVGVEVEVEVTLALCRLNWLRLNCL